MFKAGQLIVAIRKHPDGRFKKGEIFTVKGTRNAFCDCMEFMVDIGKTSGDKRQVCTDCNIYVSKDSPTIWFSNRHFAPVDYSFANMVLRKIKEDIATAVEVG